MNRAVVRFLGLALCVVGLSWLGGCRSIGGYTIESSFDESIRTVGVEIFENRTQEVGLEVALTEAVIKEIQARTPWRVTDADVADTVLTGVIQRADYGRLSRTPGVGLTQEATLQLSVDFDWTRGSTGEVLARRMSLEGLGTFVPARGVGERMEVGQLDAIRATARRIVDEMRSAW